MLIDTHCHLAFKAFNDSWQDVVKRAREKGIQMICVGAAKATSEKSIAIAEKSDGVFATVGLHPTHTDEVFDYEWFKKAAENPKVVAIGETGIDHYHLPPHPTLSPGGRGDKQSREIVLQQQEDLLRQHLTIAREKKLPVILHSRDRPTPSAVAKAMADKRLRQAGGPHEKNETSYDHLLRIVKEFGYLNCVLHCFGGSWETAKKFLDLGLMISFTGIVTFKNARSKPSPLLRQGFGGQAYPLPGRERGLEEVVRNVPLDRFMVETDSPYLAPEPYRGKENEPAFVEYVARGIAQIRGVDYDTIARAATENARKFFNI